MKYMSYLLMSALLALSHLTFAEEQNNFPADEAVQCACDQTEAQQQCSSCSKSCCSEQRCPTKAVNIQEKLQCAHCPCMVVAENAQSPAVCACCQSVDGRAAFCMCEQNTNLNDCMGCSKKKISHDQN